MKIVNVALSQIIAASTEMYGKDAQGEAMSRRGGSLWDDDDENFE